MSGVFQTIDTPPPLHPASCSSPRTKGGGGVVNTRRAVRGWGVNSSEDARHWIGLLQYNPSTSRCIEKPKEWDPCKGRRLIFWRIKLLRVWVTGKNSPAYKFASYFIVPMFNDDLRIDLLLPPPPPNFSMVPEEVMTYKFLPLKCSPSSHRQLKITWEKSAVKKTNENVVIYHMNSNASWCKEDCAVLPSPTTHPRSII